MTRRRHRPRSTARHAHGHRPYVPDGPPATPSRATAAVVVAAGAAACVAAVVALAHLRTTPLPEHLLEASEWSDWAVRQRPTDVVLAVARPVALAAVVLAGGVSAGLVVHSVWALRRGRGLHRWAAASMAFPLLAALAASTPAGAATDAGAPTLPGASSPPTVELADDGTVAVRPERVDVRSGRHSGADPAGPTRPPSDAPSRTTTTERATTTTGPVRSAVTRTTEARGPAGASRPAPRPADRRRTADASTTAPTTTSAPTVDPAPDRPADAGPVDLRSVPPVAPARPPEAPATEAAPPVGSGAAGNGATGTAGTVTVRPGDSLWSIAERTVAARTGAAPTDAATAAYWTRLIEANRDRLVQRDDPGLILPGQVLTLP